MWNIVLSKLTILKHGPKKKNDFVYLLFTVMLKLSKS